MLLRRRPFSSENHRGLGASQYRQPLRHCKDQGNYRQESFSAAQQARLGQRVQATSDTAKGAAKDAVEQGLKLYDQKQYDQALRSFQKATQSEPRPEEAQAAYYNAACCHVKLKEWQQAADAVATAVNEYSLNLKIPMEVDFESIASPSGLSHSTCLEMH